MAAAHHAQAQAQAQHAAEIARLQAQQANPTPWLSGPVGHGPAVSPIPSPIATPPDENAARAAQPVIEQAELDKVYNPDRVIERQLRAAVTARRQLLQRLTQAYHQPQSLSLPQLEELIGQARAKPAVPPIEQLHIHVDIAIYMPRSQLCLGVRAVMQSYMYHSVRSLNRFFPGTTVRWCINHFGQPNQTIEANAFVEVRSRNILAPVIPATGAADAPSTHTAIASAIAASRLLNWQTESKEKRARVVMIVSDTPCLDNDPAGPIEPLIADLWARFGIQFAFAGIHSSMAATGAMAERIRQQPTSLPNGVIPTNANPPVVMAGLQTVMMEAVKRMRKFG